MGSGVEFGEAVDKVICGENRPVSVVEEIVDLEEGEEFGGRDYWAKTA